MSGPLPTSARGVGTSERRVITALFADIAGSTAIVERMDPEDWTEIVSEAFARMNRAVERYEGTVARLMGDGLLAFFGAPIAHEDDPQRAIRCGLDMVQAIDELGATLRAKGASELRVRVGISTGPVVVGVVGTDAAHEYTAMGDAVNVASRMQSAARPGAVLITVDTYRFVAPLVDATDLGALELKGKTAAVRAYEIKAVRPGASVRGLAGIRAAMIGRDAQLTRLRDAYAVARAGQARIACVLGEPGIGKSRLLAELRAEVERGDDRARWVEARCLTYGRTVPYHLVLDLVRGLIGVSATTDEAEVREALRRASQELAGAQWAETYAYLGHLLSLELEPEMRARISSLEIEVVKRYGAGLVHLVRGRTADGPLVLVLEDLHWADVASATAMLQFLPLLADVPVLCVMTSRVDRDADGWRLISGARDLFGDALTEIRLEPLSTEDSRTLVSQLL